MARSGNSAYPIDLERGLRRENADLRTQLQQAIERAERAEAKLAQLETDLREKVESADECERVAAKTRKGYWAGLSSAYCYAADQIAAILHPKGEADAR